MFDKSRFPDLHTLVEGILIVWPDHLSFLEKSFAERSDEVMEISNQIARAAMVLADASGENLDVLSQDYMYTCRSLILPEELYFRRHGQYRVQSFAEADRECYSNSTLMARYINGLLVSNVLWSNHAKSFSAFANDYLPTVASGSRHLEVGPGHGLFLQFAAQSDRVASLTGWDVSPASIESTRRALSVLNVAKPVDLKCQDVYNAGEPPAGEGFDSVVMSEILEHVEDPFAALRAVSRWMRPGGRIWINVPANSPAPDHIYLFTGLDHAVSMVEDCGLTIIDQTAFPMSGLTLEKAIKRKQTISCVITAEKPR